MEIVAQLRLLVPPARLTGLLAIAFRFAPATRSAGARGYPPAADAVASSWLLWVARALLGVRTGVLGSLKGDKHGRRRQKRMEARMEARVGGRRGAALKFCGWRSTRRSTNRDRAVSLRPSWLASTSRVNLGYDRRPVPRATSGTERTAWGDRVAQLTAGGCSADDEACLATVEILDHVAVWWPLTKSNAVPIRLRVAVRMSECGLYPQFSASSFPPARDRPPSTDSELRFVCHGPLSRCQLAQLTQRLQLLSR